MTGVVPNAEGVHNVAELQWKMATPAALSTVVTGLVQGSYVFKLTATDNNSNSASSTVNVTVNAAAATPPPWTNWYHEC